VARGRRTLGLALTGVLVVGAACGSGSDSTSVSTSPATDVETVDATAPPPIGRPSTAALEAFAQQLLTDTGSTGGIVAVATGDGEPVVVAIGSEATAEGGAGPPLDAGSPLHVASVTKSYVAALALVLAADGVVDLDAPIGAWLDWPADDRITLRHLLTHTSGVGLFGDGEFPSPFLALVAGGEPVTLDQVLAAARGVPSLGAPGSGTRYGNLNYILAGAVLEAAAGRPLSSLLDEHLFAPLGLDGTSYPPDEPDGGVPPVGLYEVEPGVAPVATSAIPVEAWQTAMGPSAGAVATVEDLLRWSDAVFRVGRVGGVDLAAMTDIGPGGYGLGVIGVGPDGDCVFDGCPPDARFDRWALNGDFPGASTRVLHDPTTDTTLVVFLNRNALDLDDALRQFLDQV
jgi:D-alanyl-D-alanine carboxypeptidase